MFIDGEQFRRTVKVLGAAASGLLLNACANGNPNTLTIQGRTDGSSLTGVPAGAVDAISSRFLFVDPKYVSRVAARCGGVESWVPVTHFDLFSHSIGKDAVLVNKQGCAESLGLIPSSKGGLPDTEVNYTFLDPVASPTQVRLTGSRMNEAVQGIDDQCGLQSVAPIPGVSSSRIDVAGYAIVVKRPECVDILAHLGRTVPPSLPASPAGAARTL